MTEQLYLRIIQKWWWLLVLAMLVGALAAYTVVRSQPVLYQASTKVLIGPGVDNPSPDFNALRASGQLIQTYAELPRTIPFLQAVIDELELTISPSRLESMIEVQTNTETQIVTILVQSESGEEAAKIANAVADRLVSLSPSGAESGQSQLNEQIEVQVQKLEQTIATTEATIAKLEADLQAYQEDQRASGILTQENITVKEKVLKDLEAEIQGATGDQSLSEVSESTLGYLTYSSNARLDSLKIALQKATDLNVERLILRQIALERDHLSGIQAAIAENSRLIEGLPLDEHIARVKESIARLETQLQGNLILDTRKFIDDQLRSERTRLSEALQIESDRQQLIFEKIGKERNRLSEFQQLDVETQSQLLSRIELERARLSEQQDILSRLYQPLSTAIANQVRVIEPAEAAAQVPSQREIYILLAGLASLVLSLAAVFGYEFLTHAIETPEELAAATGKPVLGRTTSRPAKLGEGAVDLAILQQPNSPAAETFRMLSAKLLFALNAGEVRAVLVGSPQAGEEARLIATNLAVGLSRAGKRVILVDATRSAPTTGEILGLRPEGDSGSPRSAVIPVDSVSGLYLYNRQHPKDPFRLYASSQVRNLLNRLKEGADLILVVSPPLTQADSLILASQMDGVLLVAPAGHVKQTTLSEIAGSLQAAEANLIGSVLHFRLPLHYRLASWLRSQASRRAKASEASPLQPKMSAAPTNLPTPDVSGRSD